MTHRGKRLTLVVLAAFVALSAIPSAVFVIPQLPPSWLGSGFFSGYMVPALALGVLVGGSALVAVIAALVRPAMTALTSAIAGVMIIGFEVVEIAVVGLAVITYGAQYPQSWLQFLYLAIGVAQLLIAYRLWAATHRPTQRLPSAHPA